MDEFPDRRL